MSYHSHSLFPTNNSSQSCQVRQGTGMTHMISNAISTVSNARWNTVWTHSTPSFHFNTSESNRGNKQNWHARSAMPHHQCIQATQNTTWTHPTRYFQVFPSLPPGPLPLPSPCQTTHTISLCQSSGDKGQKCLWRSATPHHLYTNTKHNLTTLISSFSVHSIPPPLPLTQALSPIPCPIKQLLTPILQVRAVETGVDNSKTNHTSPLAHQHQTKTQPKKTYSLFLSPLPAT